MIPIMKRSHFEWRVIRPAGHEWVGEKEFKSIISGNCNKSHRLLHYFDLTLSFELRQNIEPIVASTNANRDNFILFRHNACLHINSKNKFLDNEIVSQFSLSLIIVIHSVFFCSSLSFSIEIWIKWTGEPLFCTIYTLDDIKEIRANNIFGGIFGGKW